MKFHHCLLALLIALLLPGFIHASPERIPKAREQTKKVEPVYPADAVAAGVEGDVVARYKISPEGSITAVEFRDEADTQLKNAVTAAIQQWQYAPLDPKVYALKAEYSLVCYAFRLHGPAGVPEVKRASLPEDRWLESIPSPIYPYELLREKKPGMAIVSFQILPDGRTGGISVLKESNSEFGLAVVAMVESLRLPPPRTPQGQYQPRYQVISEHFGWEGEVEVSVSPRTKELLDASNRHDIRSLAEVIDRPRPLQTVAPVYPSRWQGKKKRPKGDAQIEFVVDVDGSVLLLRIVSASEKEFGYAAAQAVSLWKFAPGKVDGLAVPVRVQIPFEFSP